MGVLNTIIEESSSNRIPSFTFTDDEFNSLTKQQMSVVSWHQNEQHESSFLSPILNGQMQISTVCCHCKSENISYSTFREVDLDISDRNKPLYLTDLLRDYVKPVDIKDKPCYSCGEEGATKSECMSKTPETLIISKFSSFNSSIDLKRFGYTAYGKEKKFQSPVCFPVRGLDISGMLNDHISGENSSVYDLTATTNHIGTGLHGGHCVAHVWENGCWLVKSDYEPPREISESCLQGREVYTLVYTKRR
jgi:ubiquitin C-terminal hydrolase